MAKMFYTLPEAAQRLQRSEDDVLAMVKRGELTELRQGDEQVFRVDQVDLLAPEDDTASSSIEPHLPLDTEGSSIGISLEDSIGGGGAGAPASDPSDQTGISVFDADEVGEDDPAAQTQVEEVGGLGLDADSLESFGSGSGLMDLTQESDDTSLGAAGLLDDLGPPEDPAFGASDAGGGGELFEGETGDDEAQAAPASAGALVAAEPYDGAGSGLGAGMMLAAVLVVLIGMAAVVMGIVGEVPAELGIIGEWTPAILAGGGAVLAALFGVVGMVLFPKS